MYMFAWRRPWTAAFVSRPRPLEIASARRCRSAGGTCPDEAEAELALHDGRPHEEDPRSFRGLVLGRQQGRAREAPVPESSRVEIPAPPSAGSRRDFHAQWRRRGDPLESRAEHGRLGRVHD